MKGLLLQARKRVIGHLVLDKGALALTIGMGGVVLLLLAGTQILDWYWPVLLAVVSLGIGIYQLRKHIPSSYQIAQRIDRRMSLADSLSTAVYFSENPKPGLEASAALQYQVADRLASTVSLEQALPLQRSRFLLPAGILFVAATSLFVVRYVMTGSMDLRSSLVEMVVDTFFSTPEERLAAQAKRDNLRPKMSDPSQGSPEDQQQMPPDAEKGSELKQDQKSGQSSSEQNQDTDQQKGEDEGDSSKNGAPKDQQGKQNEREGEDKGDSAPQGEDQRSMLDKLRDAMSNLANKMNPSQSQESKGKGKDKQKGQKDKNGKQEPGDQGKDQQDNAEGDPQNGQQGDQANKENAKKSEAPGQQSAQDAQTGAGDNDGKKDIENAKALEAMGKVSELLSQRSAAISGEMMVEVGQTQQQLKTALTQQQAGHRDAGGEIHRDQVPLAYQSFVERYFQEVRKGSEAAEKAGTDKGKAAPSPTTPANSKGKGK